MVRQLVPAVHIGKERSRPCTRNVIGQEVVGHIGPTDRVVFRDTGPCDAVKLTGLNRRFDVFPRQGNWHHTKLAKKATGRWECEDPFALQIGQ